VESVRADVHDAQAVSDALKGAAAAVNAISLYVERGKDTFQSVHVDAARRVARCARESGVEKLVHLSGIGSDPASTSSYIRSRGQGEDVVLAELNGATIVRPAVMFGPDDAFLTMLVRLLKWLPAYPLFGHGLTKLQPAYVEDVAVV
jgi:NADH dehydrogenase